MQWSEEVAAGAWIVQGLHPFGRDVGSVVPDVFPAYARVRHPGAGTLDRPRLDALLEVLARHTTGAEACWFAVWDGYAGLQGPPATAALTRGGGDAAPRAGATAPAARLRAPERSYALHRGTLGAARALWDFSWAQSPNLWWPAGRSWCVASEVDLTSTYVGGSAALVDDLVGDRRLGAQAARPHDPIGAGAPA
ncbi:hypothetical protein ACPPVO_16185 [Dactylosporangium sp. McL0621]|uniref:hypothetical protein n=1 Tax=Dactylosporangium sp. McL0621 TaxID=3415678 RepID=UPI003CEF055F